MGRVLVLRPSVPATQMLMHAYGFEIESMYDWKSRLAGRPLKPGLKGYAAGDRVTLRCRFRKEIISAPWEPIVPLPGAADPPPRARAQKDPEPAPAPSAGGLRERLNKTLARTTGFEVRRASTKP